ncbi:MAG: hypothetical protein H7831_10840 [Magnetococcus sp. WYHC-3]
MKNSGLYYKQLCEELAQRIQLLEAMLSKKKKKKKANKDYDGDGKIESGSDEYLGSRSNAIKKAVAKSKRKDLKEYARMQDPDEMEDPDEEESIKAIIAMRKKAASMGGITDDMVNPIPGDITFQTPEQIAAMSDPSKGGQSGVFGRPTATRMEKKKSIKEGTVVTDGYIFYGGFPRKLNEQNNTHGFGSFDAPYPSKEFAELHRKFKELNAHHQLEPKDSGTKAARDAALRQVLAHPDYDAYDQAVNRKLGIEDGDGEE